MKVFNVEGSSKESVILLDGKEAQTLLDMVEVATLERPRKTTFLRLAEELQRKVACY